jgi:hypothetical protein
MAKQKTYQRQHHDSKKAKQKAKNSKTSKTENKSVEKSENKLVSTIKRILSQTWFWLVGVGAVGLIVLLHAVPGAAYSYGANFYVEYDHVVNNEAVQTDLDEFSITTNNFRQLGPNRVEFWAEASPEKLAEVREDFSDRGEIVNFLAGEQVPVNQVAKFQLSVAGTILISLVVSAISIFILMRDFSRVDQLKNWISFNLVNLLSLVVMLAGGIIISQLGLLKFTPFSFSLLSSLMGAIVVFNTFFFIRTEGDFQRSLFFRK